MNIQPTKFKPNIRFLQKVAAGKVFSWKGYSPGRGGYYGFTGGEATYERHLAAGYVNRAPGASLGVRGYVTLTELGRAALPESPKGE